MYEEHIYVTTDGKEFRFEDDAQDHQFEINTRFKSYKFPEEVSRYYIEDQEEYEQMIDRETVKGYKQHFEPFDEPDYYYIYCLERPTGVTEWGSEKYEKEYFIKKLYSFRRHMNELVERVIKRKKDVQPVWWDEGIYGKFEGWDKIKLDDEY